MTVSTNQIRKITEDLGVRLDANEALLFSRQLEHLQTEIVRVEYADKRLRELVPQAPGVDPGAQSYTWRLWDRVGMAKMLANYATDLANVAIYATENTTPIRGIALAYAYSVQDVRAAAKAGVSLNPEIAQTAREGIEDTIEQKGALGDATLNVPGLLNNANVPIMNSGFTGNWDAVGTTGLQILRDLRLIENTFIANCKGKHRPTTMVVGTSTWTQINTKEVDATNHKTAYQAFLESSPNIREIVYWPYMDLADAQGDGERILVYEKAPTNLKLVLPVDYEEFPPQAKDLTFHVPCHARMGGVVWNRPLAGLYVDAIMD